MSRRPTRYTRTYTPFPYTTLFRSLFSAGLHMTGVTDAKPPTELVNAAQVVVGTTIGCRFAGVTLGLVTRTLVASFGSTIILVASGLLFAVLLQDRKSTRLNSSH